VPLELRLAGAHLGGVTLRVLARAILLLGSTEPHYTASKIFPALLSGRPLLATRIFSHTQILDEANAWLVDATPDAIAAGIRAVLGQPDEAARRAARGRALIDREYSPRRYAEKVEAAYTHIAEAAAQRRRAASIQR